MKSKLLLILAVIMGLVTTALFFNYMKAYDLSTIANANMTEVVAARQDIRKNQKISQDMVMRVQVPSIGLHPQAVRDFSEVDGLYALAEIAKDETILTHRLGSAKEENLFVSRKIRHGYRAVSVGLNFVQSVSNLIEPDDLVDVIFNELPPEGLNELEVNTYLLIPKARVLAVGRRMQTATPESEYVEYTSVTLELKLDDAIKLINASEKGSLQLILHTKVIPAKEASNNASPSS